MNHRKKNIITHVIVAIWISGGITNLELSGKFLIEEGQLDVAVHAALKVVIEPFKKQEPRR